jgi:hypothetical protein
LNNSRAKNAISALQTVIFKDGITLANRTVVKKTITYREITVAIGILVAMVIALTLWISDPAEKITGFESPAHLDFSLTAESVLHTPSAIFAEFR